MDSLNLDVTRKRAGEEFLRSLELLGLRPEALFWAFDRAEDRLVLVLATELFDLKGPLALFELLVKAYRASALPREIDPFVVRLHSPEHRLIRYLDGWHQDDPDGTRRYGLASEQLNRPTPATSMTVEVDDVEFKTDWVYRFRLPERRDVGAIKREWARFHREIERLAA